MERLDSYATVEKMIHLGEIRLSDLEHLLDSLRQQERINTLEHEALLELAWNKSIPGYPA